MPGLDLSESDNAVEVRVDLPGTSAKDIDIQISGNLLMVGERSEAYMAENIKGLYDGHCQVDELWSFVLRKNATAKRDK